MYFVYILQSTKDKKLYTGRTEDLELRLEEHNLGKVESTKYRKPLELVYYEAYRDKQDAINRELFLKSGRGREVIKKQLKKSISKLGRWLMVNHGSPTRPNLGVSFNGRTAVSKTANGGSIPPTPAKFWRATPAGPA